jgi:hypothetical protein
MNKNNYEVNLLINNKPVREFYHNDRFYVEARQNSEYSIRIKNNSYKKIMAVLSIDGIDVLKGKPANEVEYGYVINSHMSTEIKGYRIDDNNVANFKFDDGKVSYSTQVEQKFNKKKLEKVKQGIIAPSKNNGVIGVRIWEEKEKPPVVICNSAPYYIKSNIYRNGLIGNNTIGNDTSVYYNSSHYISSRPKGREITSHITDNNITYSGLNGVSNIVPDFNLGTSWGKKQEDKVIKVTFEKASDYVDLEIFYLKREELIKLGIDLDISKKVFVSEYPKAFENKDYCREPLNWKE